MNKALFALFLLLPALAFAGGAPESAYRDAWCKEAKGITEFRLRDNTRVDCLTKNYAVEVEFASKWSQSVGQALHYARLSGEKPAVVLIIEKPADWDYYWKLVKIAKNKGIEVWYVQPTALTTEVQ